MIFGEDSGIVINISSPRPRRGDVIKEYATFNIFYGWWIILASFIMALYVAGTVFFGFTAFVEPIVKEFGWSYTQVSMIVALRGLNMGIFAPAAGYLVDKYGSRRVVMFGSFTLGLGLFMASRTNSLAWFFLSFLVISFGAGGCTSVVLMKAAASWFNRKAGLAMGLVACGFGAGGALVSLDVLIIDQFGWRVAMMALGVGSWLAGIPAAVIFREKPEDMGLLPDGEKPLPIEAESAPAPLPQVDVSISTTLRSSSYWRLNFSETIRMLVLTGVVLHIMPYLSSLGFSRTQGAIIASGIPLLSILGRLGFGWLGDQYDKKTMMAAALTFMTVGMAALYFSHNYWLIGAFLIFFSPGFGGNTTLRGSIIREYFGTRAFGRLLGVTMGVSSIGGIAGPVLAGWTFDRMGTYTPIWLVFTVLTFIAALLIFSVSSPRESQRAA